MALTEQAQAFAILHAGRDTRPYVSNIAAEVQMLSLDSIQMPVTIASAPQNAWVVSPLTTYGHYAAEESERMAPPWARSLLRNLTGWATRRMQATGMNSAVSVNNWLVSTNTYPDLKRAAVDAIRDQCAARWPAQGIWLRSLNRVQHGPLLRTLAASGFKLIPSRQVYLFDDLQGKQPRDLRRDLKLIRKTPLRYASHEDFLPTDFARVERLYAQLYLEKYSTLNPAYTAHFLQAWHQAGLLRLSGWRDADGLLQAVVGVFCQNGVSTAPIVGYNTALPQTLGLYRLLMAQVFLHAIDNNTLLNLSAGASHFKRLRGGMPAIEYSAVFARHLPAVARRMHWQLSAATTSIGVPLMKWMKL